MNEKTEFAAELLLWRHADAEDGIPDSGRALTKKGLKQARQVALWLKPRLPDGCLILASPAKRAQQTAAALELPYSTDPRIGVHASVADIMAAAGWPQRKGAVLVVGHQPTLGQVAASVLAGAPEDWAIKKGALWWFSNCAGETILRAAVSPELL
jgi:phosphohistidine phosphatase